MYKTPLSALKNQFSTCITTFNIVYIYKGLEWVLGETTTFLLYFISFLEEVNDPFLSDMLT